MSTFDDFMIGQASEKNRDIQQLLNEVAALKSQVSVLTKERDTNLTAFDRAVEDGHRVEKRLIEELQGVRVRMVAAEKRLSAVSEVVPLATIQAKELHNARHGNIHSPDDFSFETCESCAPIRTALTNYEKAQQKEGQ